MGVLINNYTAVTGWDRILDGIYEYCEENGIFEGNMMDPPELMDIIIGYFQARGLVWPKDSSQALGWMHAEIGELYEIRLARTGVGWVRNNPDDHDVNTLQALAEEYGDVLMMLMVAAFLDGVDPIKALYNKMERKVEEMKE